MFANHGRDDVWKRLGEIVIATRQYAKARVGKVAKKQVSHGLGADGIRIADQDQRRRGDPTHPVREIGSVGHKPIRHVGKLCLVGRTPVFAAECCHIHTARRSAKTKCGHACWFLYREARSQYTPHGLRNDMKAACRKSSEEPLEERIE